MSNVVDRKVLRLEIRPVYPPELDVSAIQLVKCVINTNQFVKYKAFLNPSLVSFPKEPPDVSVSSGMGALPVVVEDEPLRDPPSPVVPSSPEAVVWPDLETTLVVMDGVPLEESSSSTVLSRSETVV